MKQPNRALKFTFQLIPMFIPTVKSHIIVKRCTFVSGIGIGVVIRTTQRERLISIGIGTICICLYIYM